MTETELAKAIADGDKDAAEEFVRRLYPVVLRFAIQVTGRREDAEDIAQETFVTARQRIGSFRGKSSLTTWIHKIALNKCRRSLRQRRPLVLVEGDKAEPDSGIAAFEAGHILRGALQKLSAKHREAFVLFEIEELPMAEVAKVLGVPVGTAKARVFYARQNLRIFLEGRREVKADGIKHSTSNG